MLHLFKGSIEGTSPGEKKIQAHVDSRKCNNTWSAGRFHHISAAILILIWSIKVIQNQSQPKNNKCNYSSIIVPADVVALLDARPSAGTVMTKFGSHIYMDWHLKGEEMMRLT